MKIKNGLTDPVSVGEITKQPTVAPEFPDCSLNRI
jgi:hypothetical protein